MKHLKLFDNTTHKYNIGEYVLLDLDKIRSENIRTNSKDEPKNNVAVIVNISNRSDYPYSVKSDDGSICLVAETEILKVISKEEYKDILNLQKYNL